MYSISGYGQMIADNVRMGAYVEALRKAVKPGAVVLDIGAGTGVFSILAKQFGARRVYAVEPSDAIWLAKETAAENGLADSIDFYQGMSTQLDFPELADVVISDLRGVLPLFQQHIPSIVDARKRLLAPGGVMIPQRDKLWLACVESEELYRWVEKPWADRPFGIGMNAAAKVVSNLWTRAEIGPEHLLCAPTELGELDYRTIEDPNFSEEATVTLTRDGRAHGVCAWFDASLADGIGFSNAPGEPGAIYGKAFFPWPESVSVAAGDTLKVMMKAKLIGEDYVWGWNSLLLDQGNPAAVKAHFRQSSFYGEPFSPQKLRRKTAAHVPILGTDGQIDRQILELMAGQVALGDIARQISEHYPQRFPRWQDALTRVGDLSLKYGG
jgi:protein arginine N-methyltransferase 1